MAATKATNNKKKSPSKGAKVQQIEKTKWFDTTKRETSLILSGVALLMISLFFALACISYLVTGREDQRLIEAGQWTEMSNWAGAIGAYSSSFVMNHGFGLGVFFLVALMFVGALRLLGLRHVRMWKWVLNCFILTIWSSVACDYWIKPILHYTETLDFMSPGGVHGEYIVEYIRTYLGSFGVFMTLIITGVCYMAYVSGETVRYISRLMNPLNNLMKPKDANADETEDNESNEEETTEEETPDNVLTLTDETPMETENLEAKELEINEEPIEATPVEKPAVASDTEFTIEAASEEEKSDSKTVGDEIDNREPYDPKKDLENYRYPSINLLEKHGNSNISIDIDEQNSNKDRIIKVLKDFGVEISTIKATVGPTITLYEIQPAPGVKISKIRNLEDDIALSLAALGIRIIAPIPGKGTIGIEVPNAKPQIVSMESIINSKKFKETDYELPCAVGKTISNEVYMFDLAKMPHLLVAGATGQGKSVGLNAIITSLLYKKHPAELKLVMVDPKKVEFSIYSPLVRHFLAQVEDEPEDDAIITDVKKVVATLNSLCAEMDARYDLLKRARVRNIKEYNARFKSRELSPKNDHRFLPYIVVIVDEFGDLIMTAGKEIELPIARIAQLARAVGIHMIIATQRPTTNIITGTIKANFPARMAFKVSAMIDSRTILDRPGANQLVGRGDMLFLSGSEPVRVQCAFVDTPEVERITSHISKQQGYTTSLQLPRVQTDADETESREVDMTRLDPMFADVARLIVSTQSGSTSMIQRKLSLGFNRAGRLMDQMEAAGIVGPTQGSKPREVLVHDEVSLEQILTGLR